MKQISRIKGIAMMSMSMLLLMAFLLIPMSAFAASDEGTDEPASVRVYFTISEESEFLTGKDAGKRVMARVPVDVPYVDLADYGLEGYYRYETEPFEKGGKYKWPYVLVKEPTLLMCYIKALSLYYLDREFTKEDVGTKALEVSGGATSLYLLNFWGHYYNFMYFVNHEYPLQAKGWGATADYILLQDGDVIDVAMFTDTRYYQYGAFTYFDKENLSLSAGESVDLTLASTGTRSSSNGGSEGAGDPLSKEPIRVSRDYGKTWEKNVYTTDTEGKFLATFDEAGVYYVSAGPVFKNQPYKQLQCFAPPISVVEVAPKAVENGSVATADPNTVHVSWDKPNGADGYEVTYTSSSGEEKTVTVSQPEATISDANTEDCSFAVKAFVNDEYVAYGEDPKKLYSSEVIILGGYKGETIKAIEDSFDTASYRAAEQAEIEVIMENAKARLAAAKTREEAALIEQEIKSEIEKLKTDAEYTKEEQAKEEEERKAREERERREKEEEERKASERKTAAFVASAKACKVNISAKAVKAKGKAKKSKKRSAKISWKKPLIKYSANGESYTANVTGYKIYRAAKKSGKYKLVKTIKKAGTTKWTDKKLKKGKKYFYKVRPFTKISGKIYLGKWSNAAAVKTK